MAATKPRITPTGRPFWDALREGEIHIQHCAGCGSYVFYPRVICPECASRDLEWRPVTGRAALYTYTVTEPGKGDRGGEILAIVELEEGPRLASTLVGVDPDLVRIGMALDPVFDNDTFDDVTLLRFRPAVAD
jgi:uncharacterized OB-fold protein